MLRQKWLKHVVEERGDLFGVAMWVYDGAEVCKFTGTFILEKISEICIKRDAGLYRYDGLSSFTNESGTQLEKLRQKLQRLFEECHLEITAESDQKFANYYINPQTLTIKNIVI